MEGGALHRPIARPPRIVGRGQPVDDEVGIVVRPADIGTERGVAVLGHVRIERVVGRIAALAHRPDVEDLELVLGRARDRLDVLDLVGGLILDVETVPDAQVDDAQQSKPVPPVHPVRPVLPVRGTNPIKRVMKSRHPFDIYHDQYESLKELSIKDRMQGGEGSMSAMVREALDAFIQKRGGK